MTRRRWCKLVVGLALGGLPLAALAQGGGLTPPAQEGLAKDLAGIRSSLQELVSLVRRQVEGQRLELLFRQVELKGAKLAPIEAELRATRSQHEAAEDELRQLKASYDQMVEGFRQHLDAPELKPEQREQMERNVEQSVRHFTSQGELTKARAARLLEKLQLLESDARAARAEVEHWEALVDRELGR